MSLIQRTPEEVAFSESLTRYVESHQKEIATVLSEGAIGVERDILKGDVAESALKDYMSVPVYFTPAPAWVGDQPIIIDVPYHAPKSREEVMNNLKALREALGQFFYNYRILYKATAPKVTSLAAATDEAADVVESVSEAGSTKGKKEKVIKVVIKKISEKAKLLAEYSKEPSARYALTTTIKAPYSPIGTYVPVKKVKDQETFTPFVTAINTYMKKFHAKVTNFFRIAEKGPDGQPIDGIKAGCQQLIANWNITYATIVYILRQYEMNEAAIASGDFEPAPYDAREPVDGFDYELYDIFTAVQNKSAFIDCLGLMRDVFSSYAMFIFMNNEGAYGTPITTFMCDLFSTYEALLLMRPVLSNVLYYFFPVFICRESLEKMALSEMRTKIPAAIAAGNYSEGIGLCALDCTNARYVVEQCVQSLTREKAIRAPADPKVAASRSLAAAYKKAVDSGMWADLVAKADGDQEKLGDLLAHMC